MSRRGTVLIEFALAVPAAVILLFGVFDFGSALYDYDLVSNAARLGTRYAIVRGSLCSVTGCPATSAAVQTYVRSQSTGIDPSNLTVTTTWSANGSCSASPYQGPGCLVTVTVSYPFSLTIHPIAHASWTMSSTSKMVIAQ